MANQNILLIAVGPDQVGLVQKISEFIVQRGGNIEDSRMAVLVGEFALIVLISGSADKLQQISDSVGKLAEQTGLTISTKQPAPKKTAEPAIPYKLVASCMDYPGIVHKLSSVVSLHGANIESMETQTYAAPITGAPIFQLEAILTLPARVNINKLRAAFEEMEREENINIDLEPITRFEE